MTAQFVSIEDTWTAIDDVFHYYQNIKTRMSYNDWESLKAELKAKMKTLQSKENRSQ